MNKNLLTSLGLSFYLAANLSVQTNNISQLDTKISAYQTEINSCIANISKTNASREEMSGFSFDTNFILEKYEKFRSSLGSNDLSKVESNYQLTFSLLDLYIKKAERQIYSSEFDKKIPNINSLESAIGDYEKAYILLKKLEGKDEFIEGARRIENGLGRSIIGLNNYAQFYRQDVFMNPDKKELEFNPVSKIKEHRDEIRAKRIYLEEITVCKNGVERSLASIKSATSATNGIDALDKLIIGSQWLTTILEKDKSLFTNYFTEYNSIAKPAMTVIGKNYSPEKMKEFSRFYEPLKSHYLYITQSNKK